MVRDLVIAQYEHVIQCIQEKGTSGLFGVHICIELFDLDAVEAVAYFRDNRPTELLHPEFYKDHTYHETKSSWWYPTCAADKAVLKPFAHANKQRIKFLRHLIKQLKKESEIL